MERETQQPGSQPSRSTDWIWVTVGTLVAFGLRVLKAFSWQYAADSDTGIVQLMAKHMVEGRDLPVFFYGQPYMGSLEPAFSALMCRLFGTTSLMVALSTAILGTLSVPLVYWWGRSAGGRRVGLLAMIYCLVGSDSYFFYSVVPRGGYMTMLVGGLLTLCLALDISRRYSENRPASLWKYLALGLTAGLAWWSNQLVVPFLATAALVLLPTIRKGWVGLGMAAAGFVIGSAPWWGWNCFHQWQSISYFTTSSKNWPFSTGLLNAWGAFCGLFEINPNHWLKTIRLVLLMTLMAGFVLLWIQGLLRRTDRPYAAGRWAAILVSMILILLYARSDYGSPPASRYLMPMFPAVAVILGVSIDGLIRRFRYPIGLAVYLLALPLSLYTLPSMFKTVAAERSFWTAVEQDAPHVATLCDGVALGDWEWNWLNFAGREKLTVSMVPKDRYVPYNVRGELAEQPGFVEDYARVNTFIENTGASCMQTNFAERLLFTYAVTPPPSDWNYVDAAELTDLQDDQGTDLRAALTDSDFGTGWTSTVEPDHPHHLICTFQHPVDLCGLRYITPDDRGPHRILIEGQTSPQGEWIPLLPKTNPTMYFWSGPYPKFSGIQFFAEFRFSSPPGGVIRIRITTAPSDTPYDQRLGEVFFLKKAASPEGSVPTVNACREVLQQKGVKFFYGPRWLVSQIAAQYPRDEIVTRAPTVFQWTIQDVADYDSRNPYPLQLLDTTGFLMDSRDAPRTRATLERFHLSAEETPFGLYTLFVVRPPGLEHDAVNYPVLAWTELGCFATDPVLYRQAKAQKLYERSLLGGTNRIELLTEALQSDPGYQPARKALIAALTAVGRAPEAAKQEAELKAQTIPEIPAQIRFPNGVEFLGFTFPSHELKAGGEWTVLYYWKFPPSVWRKGPNVFVHFRGNGETKFQDDHPLLADISHAEIDGQPQDKIFTERRQLKIPATLATSDSIQCIRLGLCDENHRLCPKTEFQVENRAVLVPVSLTVTQ